QARADYDEVLGVARAHGDRRLEARVLSRLTSPELQEGDDDAVRAKIEAAMRKHHEADDTESEIHARGRLAGRCIDRGRAEEARAHYVAVGEQRYLAFVARNCASLAHERGDVAAAERHYDDAIARLGGLGRERELALLLSAFGALDAELGRIEAASHKLDEA